MHVKAGVDAGVIEVKAAEASVQVETRFQRVIYCSQELPINVGSGAKAADIGIGGKAKPVAQVAAISYADQRVGPAEP